MEDAQPNEVRLSRKGSTTIPVVRCTHYGQGRGRPFRDIPHGSVNTSANHSGSQFTSNSRPLRDTSLYKPTIRLANKRKMDEGSLCRSPERQEMLAKQGSNVEIHSKREYVTLKLPPECRKGIPGSHRARNTWIHTQRMYFGTKRDLSVVDFKYIDREQNVMFTCRRNKVPQKTPKDAGANGELAVSVPEVGSSSSTIRWPVSDTRIFTVAQVPDMTAESDGIQQGNERSGCVGAIRDSELNVRPTSRMPIIVASRTAASQSPAIVHCQARRPNEGQGDQTLHEAGLNAMGSRDPPRIFPQKDIIDLTLDPQSPETRRWTTFRSGAIEVPLLSLGNSSSERPLGLAASPLSHSMTRVPPRRIEGVDEMIDLTEPKEQRDSTYPEISSQARLRSAEFHRDDNDLDVSLSSLVHRNRSAPATCMSGFSHQPMVAVDAASAASTLSNGAPFHWDLSLAGEKLGLPLKPHDKPRRILRECNSSHVVVTMHGFIDGLLGTGSLKRHRNLRCPPLPSQEFVDDACILEIHHASAMVIAHARENRQLTLFASRDGHELQFYPLDRPWNTAKRGGVSALTTLMQPLHFASGGYDHKVHLWHIEDDFSGASSMELAIRHTSVVHSLMPLLDTTHKLVSAGADCNVHLWDMSSERVAYSFKTSSIPYNVHRTDSPFCTLLEVAHRELQFEIRDHRMVPELPTQRFGFYTEDIHGRYMKGDTWSHYFASGNRCGELRLWDLRNVSGHSAHHRCFDDQVIQVMKTGEHVLACSKRNEFVLINVNLDGG